MVCLVDRIAVQHRVDCGWICLNNLRFSKGDFGFYSWMPTNRFGWSVMFNARGTGFCKVDALVERGLPNAHIKGSECKKRCGSLMELR